MADLSTEQLEAMFKKVLEPVTVALDSLQLGLDSVKRTVNAIETLPDRKSTRLNSSHPRLSRMPSSA